MNETELARMVVRILGDSTSYLRSLSQVGSATIQVTRMVEAQSAQIIRFQQSIVGLGDQIKYALLGAVGVVGLFGTALGALQRSAEAENLRTSFGTMLQDAEAGAIVMRQIQKFAAETPLGTNTLAQAAKMLFQSEAATPQNLIPTLRMLGDVVSGDESKLMQMAYAFQQVKSAGRLMGGELMQMMNAGFNPLQEISRTTGKSVAQLRQEMEDGKITFEVVKNVFRTATSEGGRFFGGMESGSKTLSGLFSTLKDDVSLALQAIGDRAVETFDLKQVIRNLSSVAQVVGYWAGVVFDGFVYAGKAVKVFIDQNKELVVIVGRVAAGVAGLWVVMKAGQLVLATIGFLMMALKVDLVLSTALWLAQSSALLVYKAAGVIAAGATWLLNAALTALLSLNILSFGASLVTAAAALMAISVAAAAVYGAIMGVVKAATSLVQLFGSMGGQGLEALGYVTREFRRWENVLSDVSNAFTINFETGWRMVVLYGKLAVEEIKALWPPFWTFLQEGFAIVWKVVSFTFVTEFHRAMAETLSAVARNADVFGVNKAKIESDIEWMNTKVRDGQRKMGELAGEDMQKALNKLNDALDHVAENPGIRAANENIKQFRAQVEQMDQERIMDEIFGQIEDEERLKKLGNPGVTAMGQVTKAAHHAHDAVMKVNAALTGGSEGYSRLIEHRDFLLSRFESTKNIASAPNPMGNGARFAGVATNEEKLLGRIAKATEKDAGRPIVVLEPANI